MTRADLPLMHEWLQREHVRRWWTERQTYEDLVEHYLPAIEGRESTELYFMLVDKDLRIRGAYDSNDIHRLDELVRDARYLARTQ